MKIIWAHPDTTPEVFSLSRDAGVGEGRGEGSLISQTDNAGGRRKPLLSPALSSISWRRGSFVFTHSGAVSGCAQIILALLALLVAGVLTGCQSPQAARPSARSASSVSTRNNCYSLLHQLLDQQKNVSLLRFIKSEPAGLKKLVNQIATTSGTGAKLLEKFARDDPAIHLDDTRLPPGEVATRDAIAATKQKELLGQSGAEFELSLLLTQTEALSYGWHLATVAAENEPQPDRARALKGISNDMQTLYVAVVTRLLVKTTARATNSIPAQTN